MTTIYALSSGSYSDYRIVALFSTPEKAETFRRAVPDSDYNDGLETFELDTDVPDLLARGYSLYTLLMLRDGSVESIRRDSIDVYTVGRVQSPHVWRRSTAPAYADKGIQDCLDITVWAKTEKAAIKIANETRAQLIALGGTPKGWSLKE